MATHPRSRPATHSHEGFSADELAAIKIALASDALRLRRELHLVVKGNDFARAPAAVEALHDQLDVAAQHSELLEDTVQAENAMAILMQTEHVLVRLEAGLYGVCENCGQGIGQPRLEAFPRATLCLPCLM